MECVLGIEDDAGGAGAVECGADLVADVVGLADTDDDGLLYVNTGFGKADLYCIDPTGSGDVTVGPGRL